MSSDYVARTLAAIHPQGARVIGRGSAVGTSYVLVPSSARPALVLPAGSRLAAAAACRLYSESQGRARLRSLVLARAFSLGVGELVFRDRVVLKGPSGHGLDDELADLLGAEVRLAFAVGKVRANRKPVLLAMGSEGEVLAFVKLGVNALTDALVAHEAAVLSSLAQRRLGVVRVPVVRNFADWGGHPMLVLSPLPVDEPRAADPEPLLQQAMVDVATSGQSPRSSLLRELPWWSEVTSTIQSLPASGNARRLRAIVESLATNADRRVPAGAWHGDWNLGNAAVLADRVLVWDWERFAAGVPLGWDALHRELWQLVPAMRHRLRPLCAAFSTARRLFSPPLASGLTTSSSSPRCISLS